MRYFMLVIILVAIIGGLVFWIIPGAWIHLRATREEVGNAIDEASSTEHLHTMARVARQDLRQGVVKALVNLKGQEIGLNNLERKVESSKLELMVKTNGIGKLTDILSKYNPGDQNIVVFGVPHKYAYLDNQLVQAVRYSEALKSRITETTQMVGRLEHAIQAGKQAIENKKARLDRDEIRQAELEAITRTYEIEAEAAKVVRGLTDSLTVSDDYSHAMAAVEKRFIERQAEREVFGGTPATNVVDELGGAGTGLEMAKRFLNPEKKIPATQGSQDGALKSILK